MILTQDGKCIICGRRDNLITLNEQDDHRVVTVICKDHLIEALLDHVACGYDIRLMIIGKKKINRKNLQKAENKVSEMVFQAIDDLKRIQEG